MVFLIILGVAAAVSFVFWELRTSFPVFNVGLFVRNRAFAFSNVAALINYSATFAVTLLLSIYLQSVRGFSPQIAGTILIAQPIVQAAVSPLAGKLSDRIEPNRCFHWHGNDDSWSYSLHFFDAGNAYTICLGESGNPWLRLRVILVA